MATALDEADQFLQNADQLIGQPTGNNEVDQFLNNTDQLITEVPDIDQQEQTIRPGTSKIESFLRGAAQGATFNFGDEAGAAFESSLGALESLLKGKNAFGQEGTFAGIKNILENYDKSLSTLREQNEAAMKSNEGAFLGGSLVGAVVTAPALQAGVVKALGGLKKASELSKITNAVRKTGALGREAVLVGNTVKTFKAAKASTDLAKTTGLARKIGAIQKEAEIIGNTTRAAKAAAKAKEAVKFNAVEGAVAGFGAGEGGFEERATLAAIGLATGAIVSKTLGKAGEFFNKAADSAIVESVRSAVSSKLDDVIESLADTTGRFALRSIKASGAGIREMRRLNKFDKISQLGQDLLNPPEISGKQLKKAVGFKTLSRTKDIIDENLELVNQQADEFVSTMDAGFDEAIKKGAPKQEAETFFKIDADEFISKAKQAINQKFKASADKPIKRELLNSIEDFSADWSGKKLGIGQAIAERQGFQRRVNFFKAGSATAPGQAASPVEQGFTSLQKLMNEMIDSKSDSIITKYFPDKTGAFKRIRQLQSNFIDASRITQDALDRKAARDIFSLSNVVLGGAGLGVGALSEGGDVITGGLKGLGLIGLAKGAGFIAPRVLANLANVSTKALGAQGTKKAADIAATGFGKAANIIASGIKNNSGKLGPFKPIILEAGKKGTPTLLATHLILFKTNEDYRRQVENLDEAD